ncbi:MAG: transketolase C-terminal domain-containing protein [Desulfobacterales bacterium]
MSPDIQKEVAMGFTYNTDTIDLLTQTEVYGKVIVQLAENDPDVVVLTSDLMRSNKTGEFKKAFPERFFNFGIAESNMVAAAAGMAVCGKKPFLSTMAAFLSLRSAEAVRTDIAYPNLNVKMIATHSGLSMGNGGTTHHATEDIAVLRSMANMTVVVPADAIETGKAVTASIGMETPLYVRIGRSLEPMAYENDRCEFTFGKSVTMRDYGSDAAVIACGVCVKAAMDAADELQAEGIKINVINMHTVKPLDAEAVLRAARSCGALLTAEEHNIIGGLGGAVSETLAEAGVGVRFKRLGVPDVYSVIGYPEELYARYGIDKNGIKASVKKILE